MIVTESKLVDSYFQKQSYLKTIECLEHTLIAGHSKEILDKFPQMVAEYPKHASGLHNLYEFVLQTGLITQLKEAWKKWIENTGDSYLKHLNNDEKMITAIRLIVDLKVLSDRIVEESLNNDISIKMTGRFSFDSFLNRNGN